MELEILVKGLQEVVSVIFTFRFSSGPFLSLTRDFQVNHFAEGEYLDGKLSGNFDNFGSHMVDFTSTWQP